MNGSVLIKSLCSSTGKIENKNNIKFIKTEKVEIVKILGRKNYDEKDKLKREKRKTKSY